jgi:hypothetical protein
MLLPGRHSTVPPFRWLAPICLVGGTYWVICLVGGTYWVAQIGFLETGLLYRWGFWGG